MVLSLAYVSYAFLTSTQLALSTRQFLQWAGLNYNYFTPDNLQMDQFSYLVHIRLVHGITEIFTLCVALTAHGHVTACTATSVNHACFPGRVEGRIWTVVPIDNADEWMALITVDI